jgi:ribosome maturation factor RimP
MSRNPLQQRLIQIIEPVLQASGFELVDVRLILEQGGWVLRVAVDLPLTGVEGTAIDLAEVPTDRVDLHDCEEVSRELSAVLDVEDPIPQAYSLEVGSPGIERPLRTAAHFQHFTGSEAKVQLAAPIQTDTGERRNFKGFLRGVQEAASGGAHVAIECDGQTFHLPINDIDHAKLVPDWDAVMRGKSGVATQTESNAAKPVKPGHRPSQKRDKQPPKKHAGSDRSKND